MTRALRRHERCLDCDQPIAAADNFCSHCGQENSDYRVSLRRLLGDLFEELFQLESRLWRSLMHLFRHPGRLTVDYNAGRRVRYTSPLRLYIIASVAYFFVVTLLPQSKNPTVQIELNGAQSELRTLPPSDGRFERFFRKRLGVVEGMDMRVVQERARQALYTNAPRVMTLLVPLFALLTWLLFRRPKLFFVEHLVLALHLHAVAFWVLLVASLPRLDDVVLWAMLPLFVWLLLALRAMFAQSWWRTIPKAVAVALVYLTFVGGGILAAILI